MVEDKQKVLLERKPSRTSERSMKEKKEEEQRVRKAYAADGTRSQKMMTFRLDNEVAEWLAQQPNKGRYINQLIAEDMRKHE